MTDKPLTPHERTGMGRPTQLTWDVFVAICAELRRTGVRYASCAAFGCQGSWVVKRIKELNEAGDTEWLELWDESLELFADDLEAEMKRRAVDGVDEPVFYKGEVVGEVRKFSDTLAIALARAHRPERFRDNVKVDANIGGGVVVLPPKMSVEDFLAQQQGDDSDSSTDT